MNKNGIVAVVVVITAVVLIGLWVMRSGQSRPGGAQFDCAAPPNAPTSFQVTKAVEAVSATWSAPAGEEMPTTYVIEAGVATGLNNAGTYVVPGTQTNYKREGVPAGTYFVRAFARNACGTSPASNEIMVTLP